MIKQIEINGEHRYIYLGFNAYEIFEEITGICLFAAEDLKFTIKNMKALVYAALRAGEEKARREGLSTEPFNFSLDDVGYWLDENQQMFTDVFNEFVNSQAPKTEKKKVK